MKFLKKLFGWESAEDTAASTKSSDDQQIMDTENPISEIDQINNQLAKSKNAEEFVLEIRRIGFTFVEETPFGITFKSSTGSVVIQVNNNKEVASGMYLNHSSGEQVRIPKPDDFVDNSLDKIDNFYAFGYPDEDTARKTFKTLSDSKLGGPGLLELRRIESDYYVVTKNLIVGSNVDMAKVYGINKAPYWESWFPYEGENKLKMVQSDVNLLETLWVDAKQEDLEFTNEHFGDYYYCCNTPSGDLKNTDEVKRRMESFK